MTKLKTGKTHSLSLVWYACVMLVYFNLIRCVYAMTQIIPWPVLEMISFLTNNKNTYIICFIKHFLFWFLHSHWITNFLTFFKNKCFFYIRNTQRSLSKQMWYLNVVFTTRLCSSAMRGLFSLFHVFSCDSTIIKVYKTGKHSSCLQFRLS